jgi:hypothetical protein
MPDLISSTQPGQLEQFIERTDHVPEPKDRNQDSTVAKRVPFATALSEELTGEQEEGLVEHALKRVADLESEMGRDLVLNQNWASSEKMSSTQVVQKATDSHLGKRSRYEDVFSNKVDWRPYVFGGIFKESNLVVPLARRIARQMIARAQNYFFETDPWFAAEPEGVEDTLLADKIDRYAKYKLKQLGSKKNKERAIKEAMIRGEAVVKTTHTVRDQLFNTYANVLIDAEDNPILDSAGGFILETDTWVEETAVDPATGQPVPTGSGKLVLKRDGVTEQPQTLLWAQRVIPKRQIIFQGPESPVVYYKDFLCPLTAADVQQADFVAHLYDKPVMELVDLYVKNGMLEATGKARLEAVQRTIQLIRELTNNTSESKSGANQSDRPGDGDDTRASLQDRGEPVAEIAECYLWYDANGDGIMENIMLVVDKKNRVPLFYDYVPNVTIDGLRPFEVVRINEVSGRWYGEGVMEMFESTQNIIDLLVNRWNHSQSRAGRVDFWRPDLTLEGRSNPNLIMNYGNSYTLAPNAKAEEALTSVYLEDTKFDNLERMFQFFMQVAQNESGTANGNDAATAGLDTQKLATGIRNIEKSGQEMFAPFISDLEPPLENILKRELLVLFANLDRAEIFNYLDRDTSTGKEIQKIDQITPEEVRNLTMNVSLLLTRYKGEQQLIQGEQASAIVERFYTLPVQIQPFVAQFYKNQLKAIDPRIDVETLIQPGIAQIAPTSASSGATKPGAAAAATQPLNPGKSPNNF